MGPTNGVWCASGQRWRPGEGQDKLKTGTKRVTETFQNTVSIDLVAPVESNAQCRLSSLALSWQKCLCYCRYDDESHSHSCLLMTRRAPTPRKMLPHWSHLLLQPQPVSHNNNNNHTGCTCCYWRWFWWCSCCCSMTTIFHLAHPKKVAALSLVRTLCRCRYSTH